MSTTKNEEKLVKEELKKLKESGNNKIERLDQVPDELAIYDPETGSRKLVKNPEADKMREEIKNKEKLKKNPERQQNQQQLKETTTPPSTKELTKQQQQQQQEKEKGEIPEQNQKRNNQRRT